MRILILYFSGTGNTKRIAEIMQQVFISRNSLCRIIPIEDITRSNEHPDFSQWDKIGIGYPVHAMDAPQIIYDLLDSLPKSHKDYFLFKTAGSSMFSAGSTLRIRERMANLGFRLCHEQLYVMPPNSFGTVSPVKVEKRYQSCRELAICSCEEILSETPHRIPEAPLRELCYAFARMEKHGAKQATRRWTVNADCTLCELCVRECPTENIKIVEGQFEFSNKCLLCLRCWWNCPTRAISHSFLKPFFLKQPYQLPPLQALDEPVD